MLREEKNRIVPKGKKLTVLRAQDAIAANFGELQMLAWRFFTISRDLQSPHLEDKGFGDQEPGPDHLRYVTAREALALYYLTNELLERAQSAAEYTHQDLVNDWENKRSVATKFDREPPPGQNSDRSN